MTEPFFIKRPQGKRLPILVSCPHVGTAIPDDIAAQLQPAARESPDTDWFVDQLYDFAPSIGVTLIAARYSRYVVDLNRAPAGGSLYGDGRKETALVPVRSFSDTPLYLGDAPDAAEVRRRTELYHHPYHLQLDTLLAELKAECGVALCLDGHSIRRLVPTIRPDPFPDLILGDADGAAADAALTTTALEVLRRSSFATAHNDPFKGGHITRRVGRPAHGIHALQLEMSQDIYMTDGAKAPDATRLAALQPVLSQLLLALGRTLTDLGGRR